MFLVKVFLVSSLTLCGAVYNSGEDYVDSVLNMLLNGDSNEIKYSGENKTEEQPFFDNGIWKCGNCDVIDETRNIYSEENTVTANGIDEEIEVQVAVSVPGSQCVTITAEETSSVLSVLKVVGSCAGDYVTFSVKSATHFTVNVYGG